MGVKVTCRDAHCKRCQTETVHTTYTPRFLPDGVRWTIVLTPFLCLLGPIGFVIGMMIPFPLVYRYSGPSAIVCESCGFKRTRSDLWKVILVVSVLGALLVAGILYLAHINGNFP